MNIQQFCEMVQQMLGYFDQDTKLDDRAILAVADGFRGQVLGKRYRDDGHLPSGDYIRTYGSEPNERIVLFDDVAGSPLKYFDLPVTIANMSGDAAIRSISNLIYPYVGWKRLSQGEIENFSTGEMTQFGGKTAYWLEGQRVWAVNVPIGQNEVLLKCVPCLTELDADDEVLGNSEIEGIIRDMTVAALREQKLTPQPQVNSPKSN